MIYWGQPNWRLIEKHNRYIKQWKADIMEKVLKEFERSQKVKTAVYIVGYDFTKDEYVESYNPVDMDIMATPKRKFDLFVFLHNIDKYIAFEPLALIMSSYLKIHSIKHEGVEIPAALFSFQTRFRAKRYVYRIIPDMTNTEEEEKLKLEEDHAASDAFLGPEIAMFDNIFPLQNSKN